MRRHSNISDVEHEIVIFYRKLAADSWGIECLSGIIKEQVSEGPKSYLMAVDESDRSKIGLDILFTLIKPHDTITVIHVTAVALDELGNAESNLIYDYYTGTLSDDAPTTNTKFISILKKEGKTVGELIKEKVDELEPDFFALSPRRDPEHKITALTEQMIVSVKANIILCKL